MSSQPSQEQKSNLTSDEVFEILKLDRRIAKLEKELLEVRRMRKTRMRSHPQAATQIGNLYRQDREMEKEAKTKVTKIVSVSQDLPGSPLVEQSGESPTETKASSGLKRKKSPEQVLKEEQQRQSALKRLKSGPLSKTPSEPSKDRIDGSNRF
jgi:hypothetical protein